MKYHIYNLSDITNAISYIGVDPVDFGLSNSMFTRPKHPPIHGIGHIYRTMIGCAMLGALLNKPREALLAFCGAYIHDLARKNDSIDCEHGANAVLHHFDKYVSIWDKYQLTDEEREHVKQAVAQHSQFEWMTPQDAGYDVMAILKDADALDRCRIDDLDVTWLRYKESRLLVKTIEHICFKSYDVNDDISFIEFLRRFV